MIEEIKSITPILIFLMGIVWLRYSERIKLQEQVSASMKADKDKTIKQLKWGLTSLAETQKMLAAVCDGQIENLSEIEIQTYNNRLENNYNYLMTVQNNQLVTEILMDSSSVAKFSSLMFMIQKEVLLSAKLESFKVNSNLTQVAEALASEIKI